MIDLQAAVREAIPRLRCAGTDLRTVEVKAAVGGLPKTIVETISAFANTDGGMIILGVDEEAGFSVRDVNAGKLAADLGAACADQLDPPIRAEIDVVEIDNRMVVAAWIEELPAERKPCFVTSRGIERGSFVRTFDGDRVLSTYEVHVLQSSRGQPVDDSAIVDGATLDDLDVLTDNVSLLRDSCTISSAHETADSPATPTGGCGKGSHHVLGSSPRTASGSRRALNSARYAAGARLKM